MLSCLLLPILEPITHLVNEDRDRLLLVDFEAKVRLFGNLLVHESVRVLVIVVVFADIRETEVSHEVLERHPEDTIIDHRGADSEIEEICV